MSGFSISTARAIGYVSNDGFTGKEVVEFAGFGKKRITVLPKVETEFARKRRLAAEAAKSN